MFVTKWIGIVVAATMLFGFVGGNLHQVSRKKKVMKIQMEIKNRGVVTLELYPEKAEKTCEQIVRLIEEGFYNGQRVHRVEDWVVQWGDPFSKEPQKNIGRVGSGGSGKNLPFESNDIPMKRGVLAMASTGAKKGGDSQMFVLKKDGDWLAGDYCAFGKVIEGIEIIDTWQKMDEIISMKTVKLIEE